MTLISKKNEKRNDVVFTDGLVVGGGGLDELSPSLIKAANVLICS